MTKPENFAAFIITHGRPDKVVTYETLRKSGYTGPIYLIVDNLDKTHDAYVAKYGTEVVVFDKAAIAKTTDQGDNFNDLRTTTHVRNATFNIARDLGYKYFVQLDDDYTGFQYRFDEQLAYRPKTLKNLDTVFAALLEFYVRSGADSIAMAQGGDFIGGGESSFAQRVSAKRKCMNSFICSTDRPFRFVSRLNEDVNTYVSLGARGRLFFTISQVNLNQAQTQATAGGMTDAYLEYGTYVKSFYTVMYQPSSVRVGTIRGRSGARRLHHAISWRNTTPMILREDVKKR